MDYSTGYIHGLEIGLAALGVLLSDPGEYERLRDMMVERIERERHLIDLRLTEMENDAT